MPVAKQPIVHQQKRVSQRVTRAQQKRDLRAHYHAEAHKFFNRKRARLARAGQAKTKTRNGVGYVVPPCAWLGTPPRLVHDPTKPPYNAATRRAMHHGTYKWE